jgi:hypothetical protein
LPKWLKERASKELFPHQERGERAWQQQERILVGMRFVLASVKELMDVIPIPIQIRWESAILFTQEAW